MAARAVQKVVVIGAGPSGLVATKTLREQGFEVVCLEATSTIGGTFVTKTYDDAQLVSSRFITPFSDFRMGPEVGDHPTLEQYVAYLQRYIDHFGIAEAIEFQCSVRDIERVSDEGGGYVVHYSNHQLQGSVELSESCDAVCVCSGLHNVPRVPKVDGIEKFRGTVIHSSQYKERSTFRGKRVLVVGCGETGLDIAYRTVLAPAASTALLARRGFLSVPTMGAGAGVPLDSMITNLFESSYVHPWLEQMKVRWRFTTHAIRAGFFLSTGTAVGFNQWAGGLAFEDVQRGHHIINKATKAMPYINRVVKRKSWVGRNLWGWADKWQAQEKDFDLDGNDGRPDIRCLRSPIKRVGQDGESVMFEDGTVEAFDVIVFATGYRQRFPFLYAREDSDLDDPLPNEHNICSSAEPRLSFLGFIRPNVGAIPPMSEMQVFWWIQRLRGEISGPAFPPTHKLRGSHCPRTAAYACDYGMYMHDLARDIGAIPDVWSWLFKSWRVALSYSLGQAYVVYFRLDGPFALLEAQSTSENELWQPIVDRSYAANFVFVLLAVAFGSMSAICWVVSSFCHLGRHLIKRSQPESYRTGQVHCSRN